MMEIQDDLSMFFEEQPVQRLDKAALKQLNPRKYWAVEKAINGMGALSAQAQGLRRVLTSYEKLIDSDDGQVLYIMWRKHPMFETRSIIIGILKIGYKELYLVDPSMSVYKTRPLCVLDFYVHDTLQRRGNGHAMFEFMLQQEKCEAYEVAIDKPSASLLQFMAKHYALVEPIWQSINFVVYAPFFERLQPSEVPLSPRHLPPSPKTEVSLKDSVESHEVPARARDSVSELMHGDVQMVPRILAAPNTPQGRKNARDFAHQSIW